MPPAVGLRAVKSLKATATPKLIMRKRRRFAKRFCTGTESFN